MFGFRFQDVAREFPEKHRVYLARILANMVEKGMLYKITRDNYHIIPFNADPETYVPDGHQTEPDHRRKRRKFGLKINVDPIRFKKKGLHRKMSKNVLMFSSLIPGSEKAPAVLATR